jgi:hypothetical protein
MARDIVQMKRFTSAEKVRAFTHGVTSGRRTCMAQNSQKEATDPTETTGISTRHRI